MIYIMIHKNKNGGCFLKKIIVFVFLFMSLLVLFGCSSSELENLAQDNASIAFETLMESVQSDLEIESVRFISAKAKVNTDSSQVESTSTRYYITYIIENTSIRSYAEVWVTFEYDEYRHLVYLHDSKTDLDQSYDYYLDRLKSVKNENVYKITFKQGTMSSSSIEKANNSES